MRSLLVRILKFLETLFVTLAVVYPIQEGEKDFHDNLEPGKSYFVKNLLEKNVTGVSNLYEGTKDSKISKANYQLAESQKYW